MIRKFVLVALCLVALSVILLATMADAQPQPLWWRLYDCDKKFDVFQDIYALADGGYALAGGTDAQEERGYPQQIWILKTDANGAKLWDKTYEGHPGFLNYYRNNIIEADNGDLLASGSTMDPRFDALRTDDLGEKIWRHQYGQPRGLSTCIIELKSGDFVLAGRTHPVKLPNQPRDDKLFIIKINGDGDSLWARLYDRNAPIENFTGLRETDGGIVASGYVEYSTDTLGGRPANYGFAIKLDEDGNEEWLRTYVVYSPRTDIVSMVAHPEGGFVMAVNTGYYPAVLKVDADGMEEWCQRYEYDQQKISANFYCIERDRDFFTLVGYAILSRPNEAPIGCPIAMGIGSDGEERWRSTFLLDDPPNQFKGLFSSIIYDSNHCGWVAGMWYNYDDPDNPQTDGLIVKFEPDQQNPVLFYYQPEDTVLYRLPGDTVTFLVRARDQQGDAMTCLWTFDGDEVGTDTTYFATFPDEYREVPASCTVSDDQGNSTTITWHVNIVPFYITAITPDSTALLIRRKSSVDFGVTVRSIPGDQFEYLWHVGRDTAGVDSVMTHEFEYTGNYKVAVKVSRNDGSADTSWSVKVVGLIGEWWPEMADTTVTQGDSLYFDVLPYKRGDDTLRYLWTLNADSISPDSEVCVTFSNLGEQKVTGYILTAADSDSVSWRVAVVPPNGTGDFRFQIADFRLSEPYPNPFNQSSVVSYQLSVGGEVNLSLYDINGRLVATLVDGWQSAGEHRAEIGTKNQKPVTSNYSLPTGIYFIRLQAGNSATIKKAIVIR